MKLNRNKVTVGLMAIAIVFLTGCVLGNATQIFIRLIRNQ